MADVLMCVREAPPLSIVWVSFWPVIGCWKVNLYQCEQHRAFTARTASSMKHNPSSSSSSSSSFHTSSRESEEANPMIRFVRLW